MRKVWLAATLVLITSAVLIGYSAVNHFSAQQAVSASSSEASSCPLMAAFSGSSCSESKVASSDSCSTKAASGCDKSEAVAAGECDGKKACDGEKVAAGECDKKKACESEKVADGECCAEKGECPMTSAKTASSNSDTENVDVTDA